MVTLKSRRMVLWYIALALVIATGIVGVLYAQKDESEDARNIADDIEIIE